jgi:putative membrane protein
MLWLKSFHIISMVCWFSGLFYLPRLFVYHAMSEDQVSRDRFKIMERKLYRAITTPAAIATLILGVIMLGMNPDYFLKQGWMHAKLTLVIVLFLYHFQCGRIIKRFEDDSNLQSHVFYRWFNEFPVFILIPIIILVIVRPF